MSLTYSGQKGVPLETCSSANPHRPRELDALPHSCQRIQLPPACPHIPFNASHDFMLLSSSLSPFFFSISVLNQSSSPCRFKLLKTVGRE